MHKQNSSLALAQEKQDEQVGEQVLASDDLKKLF
jgi:hypothetical protein